MLNVHIQHEMMEALKVYKPVAGVGMFYIQLSTKLRLYININPVSAVVMSKQETGYVVVGRPIVGSALSIVGHVRYLLDFRKEVGCRGMGGRHRFLDVS